MKFEDVSLWLMIAGLSAVLYALIVALDMMMH